MEKQAKQDGELDRLSDLPDPILYHILSLLPTKDAVRTSILSPRWRYHFISSMSILDFNDCLQDVPLQNVKSFLDFVDGLFSNPNLVSLECLRMTDRWVNHRWVNYSWLNYDDDLSMEMKNVIPWDYSCLRVFAWICAALKLGVKEIDINSLRGNFHFTLPTCLFTCESLVTLVLSMSAGKIKVPTNISLPNLKTLHFRSFDFVDGSSVLRLISGCPILEDLAIVRCKFKNISELIIKNPSLKRCVLDFREIAMDVPIDLKGICNVKSLHLGIGVVEMLIRISSLDFHELVEFEIYNLRTDWPGLIEFLHFMPHVKTLQLTLVAANDGIRPLPLEVPSCLSYHLKEIRVSQFKGDELMFEMITYFLHHATLLEKLIISMAHMNPEELSSITERLLDIPRNSKKCQVVTL